MIAPWGFSGKQRVNLRGPSGDPEVLTAKAHHPRGARAEPHPGKARSAKDERGSLRQAPRASQPLSLARLRQPIAPRAPRRGGESGRSASAGELRGKQHFCKRSPR